MLSRILWIGLAVLALVGGIIYQSGAIHALRHSDGSHGHLIASVVESGVADHMTVINANGEKVDLPREQKQELASALGEFAAAKADLALLRARNADANEIAAAEQRSERARAQVHKVRDQIHGVEDRGAVDRDALRTNAQDSVRQAVRDSIRG